MTEESRVFHSREVVPGGRSEHLARKIETMALLLSGSLSTASSNAVFWDPMGGLWMVTLPLVLVHGIMHPSAIDYNQHIVQNAAGDDN